MKVNLRNKRTGEVKSVKVGWSWTLFLFGVVLCGIPLFLRRLYAWGALVAALWIADLITSVMMAGTEIDTTINLVLALAFTGLAVLFGLKGNEMTAKNYLENGWEWADPDSSSADYARQKWKLRRRSVVDTGAALAGLGAMGATSTAAQASPLIEQGVTAIKSKATELAKDQATSFLKDQFKNILDDEDEDVAEDELEGEEN